MKPFKMLHRQELTDTRAQKCREFLQKIVDGMLPNLVFMSEKENDIQQKVSQQKDRVWASLLSTEERVITRRQNPQSVMVWTAVTETGKFSLFFVHSGVKLKSQRYIADISQS